MVAWMDDDALARTLETRKATYFSRSRGEQWVKGETSGHTQYVHSVRLDCDGDTVLLEVDQVGARLPHRRPHLLRRRQLLGRRLGYPHEARLPLPQAATHLRCGSAVTSASAARRRVFRRRGRRGVRRQARCRICSVCWSPTGQGSLDRRPSTVLVQGLSAASRDSRHGPPECLAPFPADRLRLARMLGIVVTRSPLGSRTLLARRCEATQTDLRTREFRFDVGLLADRVLSALDRMRGTRAVLGLPVGLFGASTGARRR